MAHRLAGDLYGNTTGSEHANMFTVCHHGVFAKIYFVKTVKLCLEVAKKLNSFFADLITVIHRISLESIKDSH